MILSPRPLASQRITHSFPYQGPHVRSAARSPPTGTRLPRPTRSGQNRHRPHQAPPRPLAIWRWPTARALPNRYADRRQSGRAYRYTGKGNLVAVISNGTAILGLGNLARWPPSR